MSDPYSSHITPRIIIHGGAGGISRPNLPAELYAAHRTALLRIVSSTSALFAADPATTALDAAVHAVSLLELDPLYNAGRGAVFTTAGRIEHEASVMVSDAHGSGGVDMRKRGCASVRTSCVKHPIRLAREMLLRGGEEGGGGAGGDNCLSGAYVEGLARGWGLETERPSWFWDRKRWSQHRQGLGLEDTDEVFEAEKGRVDAEAGFDVQMQGDSPVWTEDASWNGRDYLPQGTVGAVVLDRFGTICAATSTGGLTNKLPGRVGDTPTIGAGFWAESWEDHAPKHRQQRMVMLAPIEHLLRGEWMNFAQSVLPSWMVQLVGGQQVQYSTLDNLEEGKGTAGKRIHRRAVGISGTGNGDSFLRTCAARTAGAIARWSNGGTSLHHAVNAVAGSNGILQTSAEDRFNKTGEGEGGIIGIELVDGKGVIVSDHNCGGMFRAWIDEAGKARMMVFKDEF